MVIITWCFVTGDETEDENWKNSLRTLVGKGPKF